jgi:muconolactone delta-isomerase
MAWQSKRSKSLHLCTYMTIHATSSLATDTSENVRSKEAAYANTLISLGVAGLRLDAAFGKYGQSCGLTGKLTSLSFSH